MSANQGTHGTFPSEVRRVSAHASTTPVTSPAQYRTPPTGGQNVNNGPSQGLATPRRAGVNYAYYTGSPQSRRQHGGSVSSGSQVMMTPSSSGRASFSPRSRSSRASSTKQDPIASSLTGVPQLCVVQEMAYRQGQRDYGITSDQVPASPFSAQFKKVWADYYHLGKDYGGTPITVPSSNPPNPKGTSTVLINVFTQDLNNPNGTVDPEYVREICSNALTSMAALVDNIIRREGDYHNLVCDVPYPIRLALEDFNDLRERYERLKEDARVAFACATLGKY